MHSAVHGYWYTSVLYRSVLYISTHTSNTLPLRPPCKSGLTAAGHYTAAGSNGESCDAAPPDYLPRPAVRQAPGGLVGQNRVPFAGSENNLD